jgi:hypothetical protein
MDWIEREGKRSCHDAQDSLNGQRDDRRKRGLWEAYEMDEKRSEKHEMEDEQRRNAGGKNLKKKIRKCPKNSNKYAVDDIEGVDHLEDASQDERSHAAQG